MHNGSPTSSIFMLLGLIAVIYFFILHPIIRSKRAKQNAFLLDQELNILRASFIVVAGSSIPKKEIEAVIGSVTGVSETQASTKEQFTLAEKEALLALIKNAQNLGANAIIDLQLTTGSYEQQGSKWKVSQAVYTGTAVIVAK